jgi:hypothetical protein
MKKGSTRAAAQSRNISQQRRSPRGFECNGDVTPIDLVQAFPIITYRLRHVFDFQG